MNPAEDYIINQEEPFKSILLQLQVLVETSVPDLELKYKYRLPFYYLNGKPFCYFNASRKKATWMLAFGVRHTLAFIWTK